MEEKIRTQKISKQAKRIAVISAIVIVIALILAVLIHLIPSEKLEFDLTSNSLYSVTPVTKSLLADLKDDIDIVVIAEEGSRDERLDKFMNKYASLSKHISLSYADPIKQPSVLDKYEADANTVIVTNKSTGKSTDIMISGFVGYDSAILLYDQSTYYMYGQLNLVSFDAEGRLDAAINTVTGTTSHKIYYIAGHGEKTMATKVTDSIGKSNYATEILDLITSGSIPADCELLICNCPTTDMSDNELSVLRRWLTDGGKMILICDDPKLENFNELMLTYGMKMEEGHLADPGNVYENYMSSFGYYCFWPLINPDSDICQNITSNAMIIGARPMTFATPTRRSSEAEYFMASSAEGINYIEDQEGLMQGSFIIGAVAKEDIDEDRQTRLTVISCSNFVEESLLNSFGSISNLTLFMNAVNANFGDIQTVTVPAKTVGIQPNTFVSTTMWSLFFAAIVPLAFIVGGFVFWSKRRKK